MKKWVGFLLVGCLVARGALGGAATVEKAVGLADQGRVEEAIAVLEKPADNEDRVMLARLLDYDGQTEKAIATLREGLQGEIEDLNLLDLLLNIYARRGEDGPTVAYKRGSVTYSPSKDKAAEDAWKRAQLDLAVESCDMALKLDPDMDYFIYHKAAALTALERFAAAAELYEKLIAKFPEGAELRTEMATLYFHRGMTNEAVASLEKAVELGPRSVEARRRLSDQLAATGQLALAERQDQMASFYEWLPPFVGLTFTTNHFATYEVLSGAKEVSEEQRVELVDALIAAADDDDAMNFLAALCYHHADHGELETRAFQALEARGEIAIPLLLHLFESATSTCTAGQAAAALANQKRAVAVEPLIDSLPRDVRFIWTWNAAENLAKIGDARAVPELIRLLDVETELKKTEEDPMNEFAGREAARWRAAFALGAFGSERPRIEPILVKGLENPQVALACRAGLFRLTGDAGLVAEIVQELERDDSNAYLLRSTLEASDDPRAKRLLEKLPKEKE